MGCKITGDPEMPPTISTVACEVKIKDDIVFHAEYFERTNSKRRACGKN
jgi:hypothetical protein